MSEKSTSLLSTFWRSSAPYVFTLAVACVTAYFASYFYRKRSAEISDRMSYFEQIRQEEIKKISDIQAEERRAREESYKILQNELTAAKKKYEEDMKSLETRKEKEVKRLVKTYGDDASGMTEQVSRATGFPIYIPELR